MYDALNRIESTFGDGIEYWDIGFLNAWDNASDNFPIGQIGKLFSGLPENISIGNPSFAKNSPYIIVFDFLETYFDNFGQEQTDYRIKAANIERGELNDIYQNTTLGYPNYSRLDDKVLFTYNNNGSILLATIDIQSSNKTLPVAGTDVILINGAQKGVWFTTGSRDFTATEDINAGVNTLKVMPQPAAEEIWISGNIEAGNNYTVFDLAGKTILQGVVSSDRSVQTNTLLPGSYMIRVESGNGNIHTARFVKQ
jgi:hypothetical protein